MNTNSAAFHSLAALVVVYTVLSPATGAGQEVSPRTHACIVNEAADRAPMTTEWIVAYSQWSTRSSSVAQQYQLSFVAAALNEEITEGLRSAGVDLVRNIDVVMTFGENREEQLVVVAYRGTRVPSFERRGRQFGRSSCSYPGEILVFSRDASRVSTYLAGSRQPRPWRSPIAQDFQGPVFGWVWSRVVEARRERIARQVSRDLAEFGQALRDDPSASVNFQPPTEDQVQGWLRLDRVERAAATVEARNDDRVDVRAMVTVNGLNPAMAHGMCLFLQREWQQVASEAGATAAQPQTDVSCDWESVAESETLPILYRAVRPQVVRLLLDAF